MEDTKDFQEITSVANLLLKAELTGEGWATSETSSELDQYFLLVFSSDWWKNKPLQHVS